MAGKVTPAKKRLAVVRNRRNALGSALDELRLRFSTMESRGTFVEWRQNPTTVLLLDVLREMGVVPPAMYLEHDDIALQYGVSSGLALASQVLDDPTTLFPELFSAAPGSVAPAKPDTPYPVPPDGDTGS
jgi:hypothetical protein